MSWQALPYFLPVLVVAPIVLHGTFTAEVRAELGQLFLNRLARTLIAAAAITFLALLMSCECSPVLSLLPWLIVPVLLFLVGALVGGLSMPKEARA